VSLGKKGLDVIQTGKNSLAVHCRQTAGEDQFVDVGLRTGWPQEENLEKVVRREGGPLIRAMTDSFGRDVWREYMQTRNRFASLRKEPIGLSINAVTESGISPKPLHVHIRGSVHAPGAEVGPAFPAVLNRGTGPTVLPVPEAGQDSSGRRRVLAEWIASADNPLTGRVIMNRLWQHHFGRGLVPTSSDFGKLGKLPSHPELLDWLAAELVREEWSLKAMHRRIMMSQAYQMSSAPARAGLAQDAQNSLYWRFNMRRLTAEEIRDSILAVSGRLNLEGGGPPVFPPLPSEVLATSSRPHAAWGASSPEQAARRSVYAHVKRSLRMPMLAEHDQADTDSPCAVRFATTVPTQALGMLNSAFVNEQAGLFAERLRDSAGADSREQIRYGLRLALQRDPHENEVAHCAGLLRKLQDEAGLEPDEALQRFALLAFGCPMR
jgi:hypothetical protein